MMSRAQAVAQRMARLSTAARARVFAGLTPRELEGLLYEWRFWARPEQLPPEGEWTTWGILAGRGFGKTRTGAEWVRDEAMRGEVGRFALVAPTAADARDVLVEGESGILAISPRWFRPQYEPSKRRLTWPNGVLASLFSAEEPDRLRGPQFHRAWCDELAAWENLEKTLDNLLMGLRLGRSPKWIYTTTPRPLSILREHLADAKDPATGIVLTRGRTLDNRGNLPKQYFNLLKKYEGTELGRQELEGVVLDDREGALFNGAWFRHADAKREDMRLVVVGVDPAVTTSRDADESGIIVAGLRDVDELGHVLADRSGKYTPDRFAREVLRAFDQFEADRIVIETNRGGHFVRTPIESALRAAGRSLASVPIVEVRASSGKATRAEPIAALYEQRRILHAPGLEKLEKQMIEWDPARSISPDRIDAMVWALTNLVVDLRCDDYEPTRGRKLDRTTGGAFAGERDAELVDEADEADEDLDDDDGRWS